MLKRPFPRRANLKGDPMQLSKVLMLAMVGVMALAVVAQAGNNKFGVGDVRTVTFSDEFRIGEALLPGGEYEIRHVMDGKDHVMVFHKLSGKAVDVKAKCTLEPLTEKAAQSQQDVEAIRRRAVPRVGAGWQLCRARLKDGPRPFVG